MSNIKVVEYVILLDERTIQVWLMIMLLMEIKGRKKNQDFVLFLIGTKIANAFIYHLNSWDEIVKNSSRCLIIDAKWKKKL